MTVTVTRIPNVVKGRSQLVHFTSHYDKPWVALHNRLVIECCKELNEYKAKLLGLIWTQCVSVSRQTFNKHVFRCFIAKVAPNIPLQRKSRYYDASKVRLEWSYNIQAVDAPVKSRFNILGFEVDHNATAVHDSLNLMDDVVNKAEVPTIKEIKSNGRETKYLYKAVGDGQGRWKRDAPPLPNGWTAERILNSFQARVSRYDSLFRANPADSEYMTTAPALHADA